VPAPSSLPILSWPIAVVLGVVAVLLALAAIGGRRRTAPRRLPERWSVDVLRHVPGWQVLAAPAGSGLDRVVIAPGAVLAVVMRSDDGDGARVAATAGAEYLRRTLRAGRERAADPVLPVVAVTDLHAVPDRGYARSGRVHVVDGIRPERWLAQFARPDLAADDRQKIGTAFAPAGRMRSRRLGWRQVRSAA
jgi:hypothetical protein